MKRKRFSEEQIIGVLREHEAGAKASDLSRTHGGCGVIVKSWCRCFQAVRLVIISPSLNLSPCMTLAIW